MAREKIGRNDPCPCGSGKKYKLCCATKTGGLTMAGWLTIAAIVVAAGVLVYFVLNAAQSDGPIGGRCPPGQVWSAEHGHCH
jgi:hypothetical protein